MFGSCVVEIFYGRNSFPTSSTLEMLRKDGLFPGLCRIHPLFLLWILPELTSSLILLLQLEYAALDAAVLVHIFTHVRDQSQPAAAGDERLGWKSHIVSTWNAEITLAPSRPDHLSVSPPPSLHFVPDFTHRYRQEVQKGIREGREVHTGIGRGLKLRNIRPLHLPNSHLVYKSPSSVWWLENICRGGSVHSSFSRTPPNIQKFIGPPNCRDTLWHCIKY